MESNGNAGNGVPVAQVLGLLAFIGSVAVFVFVLMFMNAGSGGTVLHGVGNPDDSGPPLAVAAAAGLAAVCAFAVPSLALRSRMRRIDDAKSLDAYAGALFVMTVAFGLAVNLLGFIAAFMTQELAHLLVAVLVAAAPLALVWPTKRRREKWAGAGTGGV